MNKGIFTPPLRTALVDDNRHVTAPWGAFFQAGKTPLLQGTHAERTAKYDANDYDPGVLFYESDRTVTYLNTADPTNRTNKWVYLAGTMRDTLANKPTLGADDAGFLFYGTNYDHTWRWSGSAWAYAPGERQPGEIAFFAVSAPTGWVTCNGATVTRSTSAAGTTSVTVPNLIGNYIKGGSAYSGSVVAAVDPVLSGDTDSDGNHTHAISLTTSAPSGTVASGGAGTAASDSHTHSVSGYTNIDGAHTHSLSGVSITGGEPAHVELIPCFRI